MAAGQPGLRLVFRLLSRRGARITFHAIAATDASILHPGLGAQDYTRHESGEWLEGSIALGRRRAFALEAPGHDLWRNELPLDRSPATDGVHSAELFANEARTVVGAAARERPLFLYYAAQTPHAHFVDGTPQRHVAAARRMGFGGGDARSDVAALVAALDEQVGAVFEAFEARKRPLVFWFLGDNGPEAGTGASAFPFRGAKRTVFEGGIRTPSFGAGTVSKTSRLGPRRWRQAHAIDAT